MRVEPPSLPTGFGFGGPSLSVAAEAKLFAQLATLAPTASPQAAAATGQQMTPQQINTYWLFRALSDFTMLGLTQNGHYPPNAYQPYLNDLKYLLSQNPSLDPTILQYLKNYTTGNNYTQIPAQLTEILNTFANILSTPSTNYDFSNFTQDQMFYFYNFNMAFALAEGSEIPDFWNHLATGKTSAMGTSMGEFITTYFYERNLKNGAEDYAGLKNDLAAFMAQFNPMISTYGAGFQKNFPDIYNMLNGGTDEGGTPYAGLLKDILDIQDPSKWPFSHDNPPPKITLETPPPPWDNPSGTPVFTYPTGAYDPGCNFFAFVEGFLTEYFKP